MNTDYLLGSTYLDSGYLNDFRNKYNTECRFKDLKYTPQGSFYSAINSYYQTLSLPLFLTLYAAARFRNFWDHEYEHSFSLYLAENAKSLYDIIMKAMAAKRYIPDKEIISRFGIKAVEIVSGAITSGIDEEEEALAIKNLIPILKDNLLFYSASSAVSEFIDKSSYSELVEAAKYISISGSSINIISILFSISVYGKLTDVQKIAHYELGVRLEEAEKFINWYQIAALKTKNITINQALDFDCIKLQALEAGAALEDALKFDNFYQLQALEKGVSPERALQFKEFSQVIELDNLLLQEKYLFSDNFGQTEELNIEIIAEKALNYENIKETETRDILSSSLGTNMELPGTIEKSDLDTNHIESVGIYL